jgi:two-component system, NarL family, sensor histidine kinase UhpB
MQSVTKPAASPAPRSDAYIIIAALPFVVVCIIAAFLAAEQARAIALNEALGRARTAMGVVDSELRSHILTIEALATSRSVEKGDLRTLYEECRRVMASQPAWLNISLQSRTGAQIFNAILPYGSPAAPQVDQDSLERALERRTPQIGNVAVGPAIDRAATRVRVPIVTDGKVRYVISVPLKPQLFEGLLRAQDLPANWDITLLDGNKRLIAAVPAPSAARAEADPLEARRNAARRAAEGFSQVARADGSEVYTSYVTSTVSGWIINVSVPKDSIEAAAWNGARPIAIGLMAALVLATFMVWLGGRRAG